MKRYMLLSVALLTACVTPVTEQQIDQKTSATNDTVKVMVLGSFHFAGSTTDLINIQPDNVLAPDRQAELEQLSQALQSFNPTVIVTERVTAAPDYFDPVYAEFKDEMLATDPNERVQIAYRLANDANIDRVYGIDEAAAEDEPDYFPFGAVMTHAERSGQMNELQVLLDRFEARAEAEMSRLQSLTIADALFEVNSGFLSSPEFYYALQAFDEGEMQPGAELQAYWFMRNAKIFSKLEDVTQTGDRVIVVYGAGHKYWLENLISNAPGFELVPPDAFLLLAK